MLGIFFQHYLFWVIDVIRNAEFQGMAITVCILNAEATFPTKLVALC
jgi:hypothetical protein